ncbi:ABC transporter substrate-binding protein [Verminephrobacter eiseniae]|uniref:ABC transporter substrate-binding protein n=1 Tax=Verminephrobacter eiseniae TaxID=364317 RepID=UPI0010E16056|nr:ABC transporter substrate-binding protein [Verminephrobacter eiseniae]KAB7591377.1 ABC transporter substrate-binding protein [Verminephrobacter sp. Larva24]MCW5232661.1 ABC transporter permease [Verminephrobacter eiseniae]MCW5295775.1 ABC transporter permease [Verminephrobacter eiseniae]MCW8187241.1 ABC transporter permease [Verminephrobacter eiseniae]MCW8226061.1 ABC transporter permease [Verminephrobacter eiseniae]
MSTRRIVLSRSAAIVGAAATGWLLPATAGAQSAKLRVGLMLPYTGTYAQLGVAVENGVRMAIDQQGGKLGGREIEWFKVDDESEPSKAVENASKLVQRDKVQVLIGTVHSGVQMGIQKVARETGVLSLIPNAGAHAATRALCAPNVFRTSFTNAQITLALGPAMVARGHKKAVWITWKYAAGEEAFEGFKQSYPAAGGSIIKELGLPFPNVEFQALLTEIAALQPDAVACFFAGGGAAKFIRDYAAAGLKDKIALYGSGFLTEGVLDAAGPAADGIITTMHYSDSLDTPRNKQFRMEYAKTFRSQPDVYAMQGYDTGLLLVHGAKAVQGDMEAKPALYRALESAVIDSPRGRWTMSRAHNPVQDIYLRRVENMENKVIGVAAKAQADSGAGCRMG